MAAPDPEFDAIIVAGGRARRLGGVDKPGQGVGGLSLLERVLQASAAAQRQIVVAPSGLASVDAARQRWPDVIQTQEAPPDGGPLAAVAAGLSFCTAPVVLLLAADLPFVAPALPLLLASADGGQVTMLFDPTGRANPLVSAWPRPALLAALATIGDPSGQPMRRLTAAAPDLVALRDADDWGADCDTPDDLATARRRSARGHSAPDRSAPDRSVHSTRSAPE